MIKKIILLVLLIISSINLYAQEGDKIKVMDHSFYEEVLFPGYEKLNAVWDVHSSGKYVYIALCAEAPYSESAALFRYDTRTGEKKMILNPDEVAGVDLNTGVLPQSKIHTAMRTMKDGRIFMVSHNTAAGKYHPYWGLYNLWHDPTGFSSHAFIYDPKTDSVSYKGIPINNVDFFYGEIDREWNLYYVSDIRTRTLIVIDLDDFSITEIAGQPSDIAIIVDDDHMVYTYDNKLRVWKWDPFKKETTMTNLRMPHSPLLPESKGMCTYSWKDDDGWIYAVVQYNNRICRFKPNEGIMEDLGNPTPWQEDMEHYNPKRIFAWAPVRARNGKIYYGVINTNKPYLDGALVMELDPETKKKRNLGTMKLSDGTNAWLFGEGTLGEDGKIYWGDGNHEYRSAMMWIFDPSKIPDDYEPTEETEKVNRMVPPYETKRVEIKDNNKLWRLRPQIKTFRKFKPLHNMWNDKLDGEKVDTLSLIKAGYPLWDNGVYSLSEPYEGYIYGIAGEEGHNLFRVSEKDFKTEKLGKIQSKEKIYNGNGIVAGKSGVFVIGDDLYKWNKESDFTVFYDFEGEELPAALALDKKNPYIYVLTEPDNILLVLNTEDWSKVKSFQLNGPVQSRWLAPLRDGGVIGFEVNSVVYKIDKDLSLEKLTQPYPSLKGLEFISEVTSVTVDDKGNVWGGTREGYLFSVDAKTGIVANHGKPGPYYLKGVVAKDGVVYSMSGGDFGDTHLFVYSKERGFEDRGIVTRKLANSAVKGEDGKIYIGEYSSASLILRLSNK